jgi:phage gp29-like protein
MAKHAEDTTGPANVTAKGYVNGGISFYGLGYDPNEKNPACQWPASIVTYDAMLRQDAQVTSVLRALVLPILRTSWKLDPAGADDEVVDLVADDLGLQIKGREDRQPRRTRDRFDFQEHLRLALTKLRYGHSAFEQVYEVRDGVVRLRKLMWLPPRTITEFKVARDGGLVSITQRESREPIPVSQLVMHVNDREGGNWIGQSLLRPAYKFWRLKDMALQTEAETLERQGMGVPNYVAAPIPAGITDPADMLAWQKQEIERGAAYAQAFRAGAEAGGAIPNGATMELMGVKGQLPDADKALRRYDEQIAGAVLANFLKLGGSDSTGSYALGTTFADFFTMSLQAVAKELAATINAHVVEDLVDLNWGIDAVAPRVVFDEIGTTHPVTGEAIRALVESGVILADDELERDIRTKYGLPQPHPSSSREFKGSPGVGAANDTAPAAAAPAEAAATS